MHITLLIFLFTFIGLTVYQTRKIADLRDVMTDLLSLYEGEEYPSYEADSEEVADELEVRIAEEREARQNEFNERIARIKDELAQQSVPKKPSTTADILADGVYNIPHDSIAIYQTTPPDEYTL